MADYNFEILSSYDFEILTRDLLQAQWGNFIESFTSGADGGIDLRCSKSENTVIQCKRYKDWSHLKANLKKEVGKVVELNPDRYVLVTSVGLTPNNKDELILLF